MNFFDWDFDICFELLEEFSRDSKTSLNQLQ